MLWESGSQTQCYGGTRSSAVAAGAGCCVPASWELALQHSSPASSPNPHRQGPSTVQGHCSTGAGSGRYAAGCPLPAVHLGLFLLPNLPQKKHAADGRILVLWIATLCVDHMCGVKPPAISLSGNEIIKIRGGGRGTVYFLQR